MKKLLLLTVAIIFASCTKSVDFTKIKKGMKLDDVVALVGEPKEKKNIPIFGTWYVYDKYIIVFLNNKVEKCQTKAELEKKLEGFNVVLDNLSKSVESIK